MIKGYLSIVLHSHLPWVLGHGRWPHGTDWLNEATAECYIPILEQLQKLVTQGYQPLINIGITPILQEQLGSDVFHQEFSYYLKNKIKAAEDDIAEFKKKGQPDFLKTAKMWLDYYISVNESFEGVYKKDLLKSFRELQDQGHLEIITSAATHGYLPLLKYDRSVNAQIKLGTEVYKRNFRRAAQGIWLPECAYRPAYEWQPPGQSQTRYKRKGVDEFLSQHNLKFFVIDSHLLKGGQAIGIYLARFKALKALWRNFQKEFVSLKSDYKKTPYDVYLAASNPNMEPVAFLTRDPKTALQVWSGGVGYPGEACYLDFHKKKFPSGLRYWMVTDPKVNLAAKQNYNHSIVENKIQEHAQHFVSLIKRIAVAYYKETKKPACICTPFDTELFGHWWFEGPRWLYYVLKLVADDDILDLANGRKILEFFKPDKVVALPEGSWGEGGFHFIWLNEWTEWTWAQIYNAEDRFYALYDQYYNNPDIDIQRFLKQLSRELLLLQSSDWQFLISTWSARDYAELRFSRHADNFHHIADMLEHNTFSSDKKSFVKDLENQNSCFSDIDLNIFKE